MSRRKPADTPLPNGRVRRDSVSRGIRGSRAHARYGGWAISCPPKRSPARPASLARLVQAFQAFQALLALLALPAFPALQALAYKAGGRLVFRPPPVVHRQDVWKVGCPPAERQRNEVARRKSNGNASRIPSKCRVIRGAVLRTCVHRVATVHVATAHRVRSGVSRTPTRCGSCRNSSAA